MSRVNFRTARFMTSAPTLQECPPEIGAEVAFAGRSNAGKSSAINRLTQNKHLARTSQTPGRTQMINFFQLGSSPDLRLVDLPGYGYAKVSKETKSKWQKHLAQYLHERQSLRGLILLVDIRLPMQDLDSMMLNWAVESEMPVHALLTKSDKLSRGAAMNMLQKFRKEMRIAGVEELVTSQIFSALKGEGVDELSALVTQWLRPVKE